MSQSELSCVKPRSRGLWPSVLAAVAMTSLAAGVAGCFVVARDDTEVVVDPGDDPGYGNTTPDTPLQVSIDPGETITTAPGEGVGMFVEYSEDDSGGHWHVFTACDTNSSGRPCDFDAWVAPIDGSEISNVKGSELDGKDVIDLFSDGSVHLFARTTTALDGLTFDTPPGAQIELYMLLDGVQQPRFVYWVGGGVLHTGAPTDPVDFISSAATTD